MSRHLLLELALIEIFVGESNRKSNQVIGRMAANYRGNSRRINSSTQISPDRDVCPEANTAGINEQRAKLLNHLVEFGCGMAAEAIVRLGTELGMPIAFDAEAISVGEKEVTRRELKDIPENRLRTQRSPEPEDLVNHLGGQLRPDLPIRKDGFDFRREGKGAMLGLGIKERADPKSISGEKQAPAVAVPNSNRELTIQPIQAIGPIFFKKVQKHFSIR